MILAILILLAIGNTMLGWTLGVFLIGWSVGKAFGEIASRVTNGGGSSKP